MVGARSAAMTINRIADIEYDRRNPRTANRALPTGELSVGFAWVFTLVASAVLVIAAWQLNPLALKLSPVALAILFFYSYTKRFTAWSHFVLGFCLGISPAAAWIAIRGSLDCAHADSVRRGDAVGRRLRRALRLPGRGIRQVGRAAFDSEEIRHRARAADGARHARRDGRAAGVAGVEFPACRGRRGRESPWSRRCSPTSIRW